MRTLIENAYIYSARHNSFSRGELMFGDGIILSDSEAPDVVIDAGSALLIPGFVDVHTHGRAGHDFCTADTDGIKAMMKSYLSEGTTSVLATLASAPYSDLLCAADRINSVKGHTNGCEIIGIHLEGRYLNPAKRGAHAAELLVSPNAHEIEELILRMRLPCRVTAALELDSDGFAEKAYSLGATLSLGHTEADYNQALRFYNEYNIGFSHLFNAMPPLGHRDSGAVCAGLMCGAYCELICDGKHIAPEMIRLAYRCLGNTRFSLITDSMEASGCPDGEYTIAGNPCTVKNGIALTHEGKLAGSTLDMKTALENLMRFCSLPLETALRCATLTPAEEAGIDGLVGSLDPGKRADILLVHPNGDTVEIIRTICGGITYDV